MYLFGISIYNHGYQYILFITGFDNYVEPLKIYLQKYREATKGDRPSIEDIYENKVFSKL